MTKLQRYLDDHGISRSELSRRSGLDLRTVSGLCEGRRAGRLDTWYVICRALNCKIYQIMELN